MIPLLPQDTYDLLVIPGGAKGAQTMSESSLVQHLVQEYLNTGKLVAMICAGKSIQNPCVRLIQCLAFMRRVVHQGSLAALGSKLPKQPLTSHPSVKDQLKEGTHVYSMPSCIAHVGTCRF